MCVDKNPPERENSKINLKRTSTKLSVKPQQLLLPKINGKTLYLAYALHSNDDESVKNNILRLFRTLFISGNSFN